MIWSCFPVALLWSPNIRHSCIMTTQNLLNITSDLPPVAPSKQITKSRGSHLYSLRMCLYEAVFPTGLEGNARSCKTWHRPSVFLFAYVHLRDFMTVQSFNKSTKPATAINITYWLWPKPSAIQTCIPTSYISPGYFHDFGPESLAIVKIYMDCLV